MTRRRHLAAVPDPRPRCPGCRGPIDPAATKQGGWVTGPDGVEVWRQTHTTTTHPSCDRDFPRTATTRTA